MDINNTATAVTHWKGFEAVYTGRIFKLHGGIFYELKLTEGHRKGDSVVTQHAPQEARS